MNKLVKKHIDKIRDCLDLEYYDNQKEKVQNLVDKIFESVIVEGMDRFVKDDTHKVIVNTHRTTLDDFLPHLELYKYHQIPMRSVGGQNLAIPFLTVPVFGITLIADIKKMGLIKLDRIYNRQKSENGRAHREAYISVLGKLDMRLIPLWFALSDGRSKSGELLKAIAGTVKRIIEPKVEQEKALTFYPSTLDMDIIHEDKNFQTNASTVKKWGPKLGRFINAIKDANTIFIEAPRAKVKGTAYLVIGHPMKYDHEYYSSRYKNPTLQFAREIREQQIKNMTLTAPMIYFYCKHHNLEIAKIIDSAHNNLSRIGINCESVNSVTEYTEKLFHNRKVGQYYVNYGAHILDKIINFK